MPKQITPAQRAIVTGIIGQMRDGENWAQAESRHAIWLIAKEFGIEEDQKVDFKAAIDMFVNPSACAQALDALDVTHPCYRKRIPRSTKLDDYQ